MESMRRNLGAAIVVATVGVVGLSSCTAMPEPAQLSVLTDIGGQLDALEDRMDRIMWSIPSPTSLWHQLDPANEIGRTVLASDVAETTVAPYPFAFEVGADQLTFDVFVSALAPTGGELSAGGATHGYLCAAYVVHPRDQEFTRTASECPVELVPESGAVIALDDLELDDAA